MQFEIIHFLDSNKFPYAVPPKFLMYSYYTAFDLSHARINKRILHKTKASKAGTLKAFVLFYGISSHSLAVIRIVFYFHLIFQLNLIDIWFLLLKIIIYFSSFRLLLV